MNFKILRSIVPYVSVFIIAVGLIRTIVFYQYFSIRILDYIGLDEIIIQFADELVLLILYVIIIAIMIFRSRMKHLISQRLNLSNEVKKQITVPKTQDTKLGEIILYIVTILFFTSVSIIILLYKEYYFGSIMILTSIFFGVIMYLYKKYDKLHKLLFKRKLDFEVEIIILCSAAFLCASIMLSLVSANFINKGLYKGSIITTSDTTYKADSQIIYVGKTKDFVFVKSQKDSSVIVIPNGEIKKMIIKKSYF